MKKKFISLLCLLMACIVADAQGNVAKPVVTWDQYSLMMDGKRIVPVMGEIHYSRIPANEWQQEVRKMKGGEVKKD